MSLNRYKWKSVSKVYENKTEHEQLQGKGGYVADLEIHRSMELQGAVEVVMNLRSDLKLRLPDRFLLLLAAEKFQGDPGLNDRSMTGAPGRPAPSTSSEADTNSAILSAALAAATGSTSPELSYSPLLCSSSTNGTTFSGAVCAIVAATTPLSPALAG